MVGHTCLANYYLLQVGSSVGGYVLYARYRPLGCVCVPTNRFVRPGLVVNFDRAPGPLHPHAPRQIVLAGSICR